MNRNGGHHAEVHTPEPQRHPARLPSHWPRSARTVSGVLPEGVRAASVKAAVIRLTKLGFLKQVRVKRDQPHWLTDEQGRRIGLKITTAGSAAIGVGDDGKGEEQPAPEPKRRVKKAAEPGEAQREAGAPRRGSKRAQIIALMQGVTGAAPNDMVEATGWLPHTTRAALTGLRHKGYAIARAGTPRPRRCTGSTLPARALEHRRRGAHVTARINGQALERELGRVAIGSGSGPRPSTASRAVASPATSSSTHVRLSLSGSPAPTPQSRPALACRLRWQRAPDLPRALLQRILAYRIQADAAGDLDATTIKLLDRLGPGEISEIPLPELRAKPGTLLVREWDGTLQRVVVLESGFAWNGGTYESLSKVARAITGTNWNGPRFFGLRDRARAS